MSRIAVMGDIDSIYGFGALGFDTFPFTEQTEAAKKLRELADGDYSIIYMTEALAEKLSDLIDHYREELRPAIILIPGVSGNTGNGIELVKKSVEQAVGSDIIFNN